MKEEGLLEPLGTGRVFKVMEANTGRAGRLGRAGDHREPVAGTLQAEKWWRGKARE